jgi:transposase
MWTQAHRATYRQSGLALPSDLTDAQWQCLEPLIPAAKSGGRPRKTDMRAAMNAIFYLLRTGCPWRYLPRGPFPPRSTVYNIPRHTTTDGDFWTMRITPEAGDVTFFANSSRSFSRSTRLRSNVSPSV